MFKFRFRHPNLGFGRPNPEFGHPNPTFGHPNPGFLCPDPGFGCPHLGFGCSTSRNPVTGASHEKRIRNVGLSTGFLSNKL